MFCHFTEFITQLLARLLFADVVRIVHGAPQKISDEEDGRPFYGVAFDLILKGRNYSLVALGVPKIVVELSGNVIDLLFRADRT